MPAYAFALERCLLDFRGADVVRFLNGQLSNDVRKLSSQAAMHACVMTAKGRMNAEVWLTKIGDGIRLDGPPGIGEELLARLERYIISDDVSVEPATGWTLYHCTGPAGKVTPFSRRYGCDGYDTWTRLGAEVPDFGDAVLLAPAQVEALRIGQGVPKWGAELDENTIPVEAGLESDCIDYHKGCYIGQEIISRIKSVGHVNRLLIRLVASPCSSIAGGHALLAEGKIVGAITSATRSLDLENVVALAYVKRAHASPGTVLTTEAGENLAVLPLHP